MISSSFSKLLDVRMGDKNAPRTHLAASSATKEMLTSQYMASAKPDAASRRRRVGVVDYACDPVNICEQAARPGWWMVKVGRWLEV